jgi:hypothetical protein
MNRLPSRKAADTKKLSKFESVFVSPAETVRLES